MIIKGCKTIAEYAVRRWMAEQGFAEGYFDLTMNGNEAVVTDENGDALHLVYDSVGRYVRLKE